MRGGDAVRILALGAIAAASWGAPARGDGGTLRAWKRQGDLDLAVFTEPSPPVVGPVDVSVLVLDRTTGEPPGSARVAVEVVPKGRPGGATSQFATEQAATNKLLRAAVFEVRPAGRYAVAVAIDSAAGRAEVRFELEVGGARSAGAGIWPWVLWPVPVIGLYGVHRRLVARGTRRGRRA